MDHQVERGGVVPGQEDHSGFAAWLGPAAPPLRRYVQDLPDEVVSSGEALFPVIERRTFAVPEPGQRADGTVAATADRRARSADELDAADERDRRLITLLGLSASGLPQQSFGAYLTVAEQLWAGEPAEAWAAGQRMRAGGLSRDAILDRLARACTHLEERSPGAYIEALAKLAPATRSRK
jgi:hypothetical protein